MQVAQCHAQGSVTPLKFCANGVGPIFRAHPLIHRLPRGTNEESRMVGGKSEKSHGKGVPVTRWAGPTCGYRASDWFRLIWASICHNHPLQRSTRSTSSRARRRARVSGATALFLDDTSYGATAHLAGGCGTQASKARRRRTFSTRVSSTLGVKTLTRDFFENIS